VKVSRLNKMIAGVVIILIGFGLLLDNLGIISFDIFDFWPFVFFYFGHRLWSKKRRIFGGVLIGIGLIGVLDMLNIDPGVIIALGLVYFGYRLINSRKPAVKETEPESAGDLPVYVDRPAAEPAADRNVTRKQTPPFHVHVDSPLQRMRIESPVNPGQILSAKESRSALIGDFHLTSGRFELHHLHIWHGIGDVVIDLSRALIEEDETFLVIDGWVGDITVYAPVDLPISVTAEVTLGDMEIFGHRQGGLNRHVAMKSQDYETATRKVKLIISLIVGDIDVKYI
jgi:lia operon protein LiaF